MSAISNGGFGLPALGGPQHLVADEAVGDAVRAKISCHISAETTVGIAQGTRIEARTRPVARSPLAMISAIATPRTVSMLTPTTVNSVVFQKAFQNSGTGARAGERLGVVLQPHEGVALLDQPGGGVDALPGLHQRLPGGEHQREADDEGEQHQGGRSRRHAIPPSPPPAPRRGTATTVIPSASLAPAASAAASSPPPPRSPGECSS